VVPVELRYKSSFENEICEGDDTEFKRYHSPSNQKQVNNFRVYAFFAKHNLKIKYCSRFLIG
jgi:hypothetical protein